VVRLRPVGYWPFALLGLGLLNWWLPAVPVLSEMSFVVIAVLRLSPGRHDDVGLDRDTARNEKGNIENALDGCRTSGPSA